MGQQELEGVDFCNTTQLSRGIHQKNEVFPPANGSLALLC